MNWHQVNNLLFDGSGKKKIFCFVIICNFSVSLRVFQDKSPKTNKHCSGFIIGYAQLL